MRTGVRQGQAVIGVTLGHRFDYFSWRRGDALIALTRPLSDGAVPTAERLSGSNASAAPCFCHNQEDRFARLARPKCDLGLRLASVL